MYSRSDAAMIVSRRRQAALVALLSLIGLGVTLARPARSVPSPVPAVPPGAAALVDGQAVPLALYRRHLGIYQVTLPPAISSEGASVRMREGEVEDRALREAVAETLIAREAARRHLYVTASALSTALAQMQAEAGGAAALAALAHREHLSVADLRAMARTSVLNDLLLTRTGDAGLIDRLYLQAQVTYAVGPHAGRQALAPAPVPGHLAPELAVQTLTGAPVSLSQLRGAPLLLTLWSTACTWCRMELPMLDRFARQHPGLQVVGLNIGDSRATVAAYAAELHLHLPLWLDTAGTTALLYGLNGLPDTVVVDRSGTVRRIVYGTLDSAAAIAQVAAQAG